MDIIQPLKRNLSRPAITAITFVLAVIALNTWQIVLPNFHFDNSFSLAAAHHITSGEGYVTKQVLPSDVSAIVYEPINKWPPGYSWLLAGAMKLGAADAVAASYLVNGLAIVCFMAGIFLTLRSLRFPGWFINLFMLFAGFFPYAFLGAWFADLVAVSFFMLAIGLVVQAQSSSRHLLLKSMAAAVLCGYCIFLKYLYLPVAILPLVVWAWYALRLRKMQQFSAALAGAALVSAAAVLLLVYQRSHSGQPVYVNPTGRGFFPEHVLEIGALIPASLIDQDFFTLQLARLFHMSYPTAALVLRILNYVLMAGLLYWIIKWWRSDKYRNVYAYIVLVISAATAALLLFLSVTFAPYSTEFTTFWTYVEELRYYAIVIVFIQQWLFWYFLVRKPQRTPILYKLLKGLVGIIISLGILHSAYYLVKQALIKEQAGIHKINEQTDLAALQVVKKLQAQYPGLVICSNNHELANIASLGGAPVLYDFEALNGGLRTSRPVVVVAILRNDFLHRFQPFLQQYKPLKVDSRYNFSFYLATIR
jgi:hypothetical protein